MWYYYKERGKGDENGAACVGKSLSLEAGKGKVLRSTRSGFKNESEEKDGLDPLNADGDGKTGRAKTASAW